MIDDLISRLRGLRPIGERTGNSDYELINPDGPEAAEALLLLRDALALADDAISGALDDMREVDLSVSLPTKDKLIDAWAMLSTMRPDTPTKIEKAEL